MLSEQEARDRIVRAVSPRPERTVLLLESVGCFSARNVVARVPLPTFDNSAMDGYAVVASSCKKGARLRVIGEQPAGIDQRLHISRGEAVRIFTGAPMPDGADAIVMKEDVTRNGAEITVNVDLDPGDFVRRLGCDLAEGQKILAKGARIPAAKIALLASQGFT